VGLVVILIALLIVAVLAQTALKSYGLLPGSDKASAADTSAAAPPGAATRAPAAAPATPIERARGVEQQVKRDAEIQEKRIDESTQ
jgi:hypothetical protein